MRKPKIYHGVFNIGTQAGVFAEELRNKGYLACSITYPDWLKRKTDFEFKSIINAKGIFFFNYFISNFFLKLKIFFSFNIFHFYFGKTLLPFNMDLLFYKIFSKKVFMEYLGNDVQGYAVSVQKYKWTNMAHMMTPKEGNEYDSKIKKRLNFQLKYFERVLVCAPMYSEFVENSIVLPLAINIKEIKHIELPLYNGVYRIMHAPTNRGFKGTEFICKAVERLKSEGYSIEFDLVENVEHAKLAQHYTDCHLFIDQILGGWYGTASIEAMAIGRPVVAFIRPDYYEFVDYGNKIPIISANPDDIYEVLKKILDYGITYLQKKGEEGRTFVEDVHNAESVVSKLLKIYGID
jgi:glycosyltransferase involved in cell wall biosynthesis